MYSYSIFNYNSKKFIYFMWENFWVWEFYIMTLVVQVSVILTAEVESQFSTGKIWGVFLIKTSTSLKAGTIFEKLMKTHESA